MIDMADGASEQNETSIFQSNLSVEAKIEKARTELLDLSARNRLLNVPRFSKVRKPSTLSTRSRPKCFGSL